MTDDLTLSRVEREVVRWAFICRFNVAPERSRWPSFEAVGDGAEQGQAEAGGRGPEDDIPWPDHDCGRGALAAAKFTDRGLQALKQMAKDRRALDPAPASDRGVGDHS